MEHPWKVAQAEFFSYPKNATVVGIAGGQFEKTVVRLHDQTGVLSSLNEAIAATEKTSMALMHALEAALQHEQKPLLCRSLSEIGRNIARSKTELQEDLKAAVTLELAWMIGEQIPLALENPDRTFRIATPKELLAMLAAVHKATAMNLYVFPPNHLLADSHESVQAS